MIICLHTQRKKLSVKKIIPDTIAVMMNPESSHPREKEYRIPIYKYDDPKLSEKLCNNELVDTRPDNTQYQIMRVMNKHKWKCVLVINLSDIREPKSPKFFKLINQYKDLPMHSIFSKEREKEVNFLLYNIYQFNPLIVAWGKNKELEELGKQCIECFDINNIKYIGV